MTMEALPQDLADFLVTKNFDPEYFDKQGQPSEAGEATTMKFDYVADSGKNYGTAVCVISNDELSLYYGDNLGRGMEPEDKDDWYSFLEQLSNQAASHSATWSPTEINKLKHNLAGIAAIKEGLFEGYYGNRKVSYMGEQTQARLVINHNRVLGENDKRFRYVESLFIETADQERFRLPFKSLGGGRAMLEHVRSGGRPYDVRGNHITEIVGEMAVLSRFNRAQNSRVFEGVTQELVESARQYYHNLQETVKHLGSPRGYQAYFESWAPDQTGEAEALVENLRNLFVEQTLDARIEAALPTLAKIQQQGNNMKEAQIFENWINNLSEGTWALPETPEQMEKLNQLMSGELIVGPDATNATEQLYDIVGDDELFDILNDLADKSEGRANCWDDSDVQRRLAELGIQTPQSTQAQPADVPQDTAPAVKEGATPINFDKVLEAIAALYGDDMWENDAMQDLANDLEQAGPTDQELDFIIAKGRLPKRLAGIQFSAGDDVQFKESNELAEMLKHAGVPLNEDANVRRFSFGKRELDEIEAAPSINQTNTKILGKIAPPTQAAVAAPTAASIIGNSPQVKASQTTPVANPGKPEAGVAFNQAKPPPAPTAASIIGNSPQVQASKSLPTTTAAAPVAAAAAPKYDASVAFGKGSPAPVAAAPKYDASVAFGKGSPAPVAAPVAAPAAALVQRPGGIAFNQDGGAAPAAPAALVQRPGGIAFNQDGGAAPAAPAAPVQRPGGIAFNQDGGAVAEETDKDFAYILKHAGVPIKEGVLTDSTGSTMDHIQDRFRRDIKDFTETGDMSDDLYDALYDYYFDDMPYGTKKARTGDPHEWVADRFAEDIGLDENLISPMIMPVSEGSCNMTAEGSYCPEHGLMECGGMYEGVNDPDYRGGHNNEFDELEDLLSRSGMSNDDLMRQRFLASKHGLNTPADMAKLPALKKDAEAGYIARKSALDTDLEKRNQQHLQDKLTDLEYQQDPLAFVKRRTQQLAPTAPVAPSAPTLPTDVAAEPGTDYSLPRAKLGSSPSTKLPNFRPEPAAEVPAPSDQTDTRNQKPSMFQQLAQLRNRTRGTMAENNMGLEPIEKDPDWNTYDSEISGSTTVANKDGKDSYVKKTTSTDTNPVGKKRYTTTTDVDGVQTFDRRYADEGVDDPINSNSAMTGAYYEGKETPTQEGDALLARIKSLALLR